MRGFLKNTKAAVTVFVTLLLIPAILISGTAVDLARMHTARSILQDANQLAANSALTQYDALLKDLYGLFGVMADDPELAEMIDEYIETAVFGEDWHDKGIGTLQLFYGSNLSHADIAPAPGKNLRNEDVLRRQIEEYMKFRAPVIIVKEFLDAIGDNKLKDDTEIINKKLQIDASLADIHDLYKRLYEAILAADKCNQAIGGIAGGYFGTVSSTLTAIHGQFKELKACCQSWAKLSDSDKPEDIAKAQDFENKFYAILGNIASYTVGGSRGTNWSNGKWNSRGNVVGLNSNIENAKNQAENFKAKFDEVVSIAREIDVKHDELKRKIDELDQKVQRGECSEDLKRALTEPGLDGKSQLDHYRDLLRWGNIADMAETYKSNGYKFIDNTVKPMLDEVRFRNSANPSAPSLSRAELANLSIIPGFLRSDTPSAKYSKASVFADIPDANVTYKMAPGFTKFAEQSARHKEFFDYLERMMNQPPLDPVKLSDDQDDGKGKNDEEKQRSIIDAVLELVDTVYTGLTNNPLGAESIDDPGTPAPEKMGALDILTLIPEALNSPVVSIIQDPLGSASGAGDYLLLLTYCTSMFSNYTTTRPESIGKTRANLDEIAFTKSITGVPISPRVNYFFQSEWEYLYEGNTNAAKNLNAVTRLLFLVRLVCNYIRVFSVSEISTIVSSIRTAFAWCPPLSLILSELARAAFAAAETIIDIAMLRSGHKVPLLKNVAAGEWVCSPRGLINAVKNIAAEAVKKDDDAPKKEKGLSYSNYLLLFMVAKGIFYIGPEADGATELAKRCGNLIEWNVINYKENINADESKISEALSSDSRFKLSKMTTDFSITTSVDMRMLFLSMPLAQKGIQSITPPKTLPITVTDYRGY